MADVRNAASPMRRTFRLRDTEHVESASDRVGDIQLIRDGWVWWECVIVGDDKVWVNRGKAATGSMGSKGPDGDKGPAGDKGATGDRGLPGADGAKGADGNKGAAGDPGAKGDTGNPGSKGETGDRGLPGVRGDKGETGDKGATGDRGLQGLQGLVGNTGPAGPTSVLVPKFVMVATSDAAGDASFTLPAFSVTGSGFQCSAFRNSTTPVECYIRSRPAIVSGSYQAGTWVVRVSQPVVAVLGVLSLGAAGAGVEVCLVLWGS